MRLKKGSKVEVLSKREVPSGSWWCAEIVSGNGHTYYVRYDRYPQGVAAAVERVPRKVIRPSPPLVDGLMNWVAGDIVEVFENYTWKLAQVSCALGGEHFSVRILGSPRELRAHRSEIRLRQSWQNNQWFIIHKDSGKHMNKITKTHAKGGKHFMRQANSMMVQDQLLDRDENDFDVEVNKRQCIFFPPAESWNGAGKKRSKIYEERKLCSLVSQFPEKVDAVVSPRTVGENYLHATIDNKRIGNADVLKELNDARSISSSFGSCSPAHSPYLGNCPNQYLDCIADDAHTCTSESKPSYPNVERGAEEMHHLELSAYRSTVMSLHKSGPLSWEQEAMMADLRDMLHISNEEHLSELRHLISIC